MSRQDILDDPVAACPQLHQFLGAYFHQDWAVDRRDWTAVVDDFVADSPSSVVAGTADEVRDLLAAGFSDSQLGAVLDGLDASVLPSAFDLTATAWLATVLQRLDPHD